MIFKETKLKSVFVVEPEPLTDERGSFARVFCKREFAEIGFNKEFVQMNHSYSTQRGTFRGFHYQDAPMAESKLIRCVSGRALDIIIDVRRNSSTFLSYTEIEISAQNRKMVLIPEGFAHGFLTLTDNVELIYCHTEFYDKELEQGLRYDDPALKFKAIIPVSIISVRDKSYPLLNSNFVGVEV